jgi:hypothetical protein
MVALRHLIVQAIWFITMLLSAIYWFKGKDLFGSHSFSPYDNSWRIPNGIYANVISALDVFVTLLSVLDTITSIIVYQSTLCNSMGISTRVSATA